MIRLERVSKSYRTRAGRRTVLDDVGATFEAGHNFGVLGVNGAGKSTLIRLLAGSELPDRGTIRRSARVSFPLGFAGTFHGALSGRENTQFLARIYGAAMRPMLDYVANFAELGDYFEMPVDTYSAGMRARLAFAACLAINFDVYFPKPYGGSDSRAGTNKIMYIALSSASLLATPRASFPDLSLTRP